MKIAVIGLGYVGTVTAAGLASQGHEVVGVDVDELKVATINRGESPVVEPGVVDLISSANQAGVLRATTDINEAIEGSEVSLLCVGTPSGPHGSTDLTFIRRALADIRAAMGSTTPPASGHHSVVIRSTVPPGTGADDVAPTFTAETTPDGWAVGTAMCPEFLREGSGVADFFEPPFVVVGTDDAAALDSLTRMFAFLDEEVVHVSVPTAEALKYACNAFHATKVAFTNELARILRLRGVDSREVMEIFVEDRKLNVSPAYLRPGFAFGGSCLPKDLRSLLDMARDAGVDAPLLAGTALSNELVVRDIAQRILDSDHRTVCILGLSFKMDTDDLRESPNVELAERLIGKGLDVRIYDPIINPERLVGSNKAHVEARLPHLNRILARTPQEALSGAEVVVVATAAPEVVGAVEESSAALVIDLNGRLGSEIEVLPAYEGVGW